MNQNITFIRSNQLAEVDYAYASRVPSDMDLLFLAGACPLNEEGEVPYINDYEQQAKLCVENMKAVLKESGASLKDVVYTRVIVASHHQADLVTAWRSIREELGS